MMGVISPFRKGLFSRNFASAKFRKNKTLAKISEFTLIWAGLQHKVSILIRVSFVPEETLAIGYS